MSVVYRDLTIDCTTAEMLDVYLAAERITADQYIELIGLIKESEV